MKNNKAVHRWNRLTLGYIFSTDPPPDADQDTSFRLRMRINVSVCWRKMTKGKILRHHSL